MAKKVSGMVKLQIPAGQATPSPPVGPALGQHGVNIMEFCKSFNAKTKGKGQDGMIIPVVVTVYADRTFTYITKTPPAAVLLKKAAGIAKAASNVKSEVAGKVTKNQVKEIAEMKMQDLNAHTMDKAIKIIAGTARSMGIEIVD